MSVSSQLARRYGVIVNEVRRHMTVSTPSMRVLVVYDAASVSILPHAMRLVAMA